MKNVDELDQVGLWRCCHARAARLRGWRDRIPALALRLIRADVPAVPEPRESVITSDYKHQSASDKHGHDAGHVTRVPRGVAELTNTCEMVKNYVAAVCTG